MVVGCITSYGCIQVDSYLPHECLPIAVVKSLRMCLELRVEGQGKGWPLCSKRRIEVWDCRHDEMYVEIKSHSDESVDELLISSLSVQRVLEPKRRTPIGSQANSAKLTCGNQLLSNRSAVETHEAEMQVDVTLRPQFSKCDDWSHIGSGSHQITYSNPFHDAERTRIHVTIQAATPPSLRTRLRSIGSA